MYKNILCTCSIIITILLLYTRSYAAPVAPDPIEQLITKILAPTPIFDDLRYLTDTIGGRPTGSIAMHDALQWGLTRFVDSGFNHAYLDPYTAPRNWLPNIEQGEIIAPNSTTIHTPRSLRLASIPFSTSTPPGGLTAPVYALETTETNDIQMHAKQIKGHWLLLPTALMRTPDDSYKESLAPPPIFAAAKKSGAVGILWLSSRSGRLLYRRSASLNGTIVPLPAAVVEREGGERMIRTLKAGVPVIFSAKLENIIQENPRNYNVIAEIKGSKKPDEVIVLGAHLDSWDLGQGALDNGSNAVMVIDIARQMSALQPLGCRPLRTIRFILYSGEEFGLYGSWFDVKNHPQALNSIKAVIIYDVGTGRTTGFSLGGRADMKDLVNHALQPIRSLGPFNQTTDASFGTDNFDYLLQGIPTLVANQDASPYLHDYHAESDTFDKIDPRELKLNTVIAAVLTWRLANTTETIPSRQTKDEINQLLKVTGLKAEMDIYNIRNRALL